MAKQVNNNETEVKVESKEPINCLRNEIVRVRYLPKQTSMVTNPKHVLYGGLAEGAFRDFVVPVYSSNGQYYNVLTNNEKDYIEKVMGLEPNSLSIYKKKDNFWDTFTVRLTKDDLLLNLSIPMDYIRYKVLLANDLYVARSLSQLEDNPRATYQFVIVSDKDEDNSSMKKFNNNAKAYMLLGQYKDDIDTLRTLLEALEGRPTSSKITVEAAISRLDELIRNDAKLFVKFASDPLLPVKVTIKRAVEEKIISKRGTYYYLSSDNSPLCGDNSEPTLNVAAAYLAQPKNQELLFSIQGKLKETK